MISEKSYRYTVSIRKSEHNFGKALSVDDFRDIFTSQLFRRYSSTVFSTAMALS